MLTDLSMTLPFALGLALLAGGVAVAALAPRPDAVRVRGGVLGAAVGAFALFGIAFLPYTVDDAFIVLRMARNLATGHGLVFSTDGSPPVEGYTSFLGTVYEAPLFWLGLDDAGVLLALKFVGIVLGAATLLLIHRLARHVTGSPRAALLAPLLLAAVPNVAFWAVGGLETSLYLFLIALALVLWLREDRRRAPRVASLGVLALVALTRPEALAFAGVLVLWDVARGPREPNAARRLLPGLALFGLVYGTVLAWRLGHFGHFWPNTVYAKSGADTLSVRQIVERLWFLKEFLFYLLPLGAFAVVGWTRVPAGRERERELLTLVFLVFAGFAAITMGEWMPGFRYELPFLPPLAVFAALGVEALLQAAPSVRERAREARLGAAAFAVLLAVALAGASGADLSKERANAAQLARSHVALGHWLAEHAPEGSTYASFDMGAVPYYSGIPRIYDIFPSGILEPHTAHEGYDVDYFMDREPTFFVLPADDPTDPMAAFYDHPGLRAYQHVFSLAHKAEFVLEVYVRNGTTLAPAALADARAIEEASFRESYAELRIDEIPSAIDLRRFFAAYEAIAARGGGA